MNHLCATLVVMCSIFSNNPTIYLEKNNDHNEKQIFIQNISKCAVEWNAYYTEPEKRIPINLAVGISAHESGWGTSRFVQEGNNYFGMKTNSEDPDLYMIPKKNKKVKLAKYHSMCESVFDFMDLLTQNKRYKFFREELINQWFDDNIDYKVLLKTLHQYSKDKSWSIQVLKIIGQLNG